MAPSHPSWCAPCRNWGRTARERAAQLAAGDPTTGEVTVPADARVDADTPGADAPGEAADVDQSGDRTVLALPAGAISAASLGAIRDAFVMAYSARYTTVYDGARMEAINFRVRCVGPTPVLSLAGAAGGEDREHREGDSEHDGQQADQLDRGLTAGATRTDPHEAPCSGK